MDSARARGRVYLLGLGGRLPFCPPPASPPSIPPMHGTEHGHVAAGQQASNGWPPANCHKQSEVEGIAAAEVAILRGGEPSAHQWNTAFPGGMGSSGTALSTAFRGFIRPWTGFLTKMAGAGPDDGMGRGVRPARAHGTP